MAISETTNNGLFTVDRNWTVTYWNSQAENLLKVRAKDIIGKNLWEQFSGAIPLDFLEFYHKAFVQNSPNSFEEYWAEKGGWMDVITYHLPDSFSISFKSKSSPPYSTTPEQRVDILTEVYRLVSEVTDDCLWEWNLRNKEVFWIDGGHKRLFGYQIENALLPQSFWEARLHPDDKSRVLIKFNRAITSVDQCTWEDEYRFRKANGEYALVRDRGHIIYDEHKKALRMIGVTQDITSTKLTESQLFESERKLSLIARQTINAIIITDIDGKITWVNSAFTRITEYEIEEVVGKIPGDLLFGRDTDPVTLEYVTQQIKSQLPYQCEIFNYSKSGRKYWMYVQGQPMFAENGECERFFAILTDISEKIDLQNKIAEERLSRHHELTGAVLTAQENERAEIGKELHDNLNQILGATKLYVEMAKTDDENRGMFLDKCSSYLKVVIEEIRKISKNMATPGIHTMGLFDCIKILIDDLVMVEPIDIKFYRNKVKEEDLDDKLQLQLFRIVQEQLNNILKHARAKHATIDIKSNGNNIILAISDDGVGCNISEKRNGVGIRNIMSRVDLYDGKTFIKSRPGEGFDLKVLLQIQKVH